MSVVAGARFADPSRVMDPRRLGALQPTRLSAARSFLSTMINDQWTISRDELALDARGNGRARYTVSAPAGDVTFLAFLREPAGDNRTFRIIGTSWDMIGALIDGIATDEQVADTEREIPKLYEGRAPAGTLAWFRSNQSLRIFQHVRESLAAGRQPDAQRIKRVGYLMRNTGLDGNGTFGTTSFQAIPASHPLATSYFAQMLAAYLMRELSVDVVEELARLDNPVDAVRLSPDVKRFVAVGNGSALGLVMFVYNRPKLVDAYVGAYLDALAHVLNEPIDAGDPRFDLLERLLDRTIEYRLLEDTQYRVFTGSRELAADLRRIRSVVRAARRGAIKTEPGETLLGAANRWIAGRVSEDAEESFHALLLELIPEYCDTLVAERLVVDEDLPLDPTTPIAQVRSAIDGPFRWAVELPLNDDEHRDRVWYQSRAAEEPRSGPREEVPDAHEVVPNYPVAVRLLREAISDRPDDEPIGLALLERPELEYIARLVLALQDRPYAVPHADPHDSDFVPAWIIRLMNSFIHGLDRTEDYLGRIIRGLIFEGAPFRDELADADPAGWWWSYHAAGASPAAEEPLASASPTVPVSPLAASGAEPASFLKPKQSAIVAPQFDPQQHLILKLREARLVSGRAMQALNVPEGSWHGARDFFLTAILGSSDVVGTFARVLASSLDDDGHSAPWRVPTATHHQGIIEFDGQGQSLLVIGHVLTNAIGAAATPEGVAVRLRNTATDAALPGLVLALARYGIGAHVTESNGSSATIAVHSSPQPAALIARYRDEVSRFIHEGVELPAQTWWDVYFPSNAGMYPDTAISRQHTGATVADVHQPGQKLTKQFAASELFGLSDPDDADNQESGYFATADSH